MKRDLIRSAFYDDPAVLSMLEARDKEELIEKINSTPRSDIALILKGDKGDKGDTPTQDELVSLIQPLIPAPLQGIQGVAGKDGRDGRTIVGPQGEKGEAGKDSISTIEKQVIREEITLDETTVKEIIKIMRKLPENDRLDISQIRNASSFMKDGIKYKIEELMHGGSSGGGSANVTTQYVLTAVQSGSDVTIDLSQLTNFATLDEIIALYRNNVPQTQGASFNFTVSGSTVTVFGADAAEIFNLTYSFTT